MYDLSVDVISPSYYFIALTGKIMDATFVVTNSDKFLIAMMSNGTMYCQPVIPACSATEGPVYFTIDVQVKHTEMAVSLICEDFNKNCVYKLKFIVRNILLSYIRI